MERLQPLYLLKKGRKLRKRRTVAFASAAVVAIGLFALRPARRRPSLFRAVPTMALLAAMMSAHAALLSMSLGMLRRRLMVSSDLMMSP